jgi:hypothetical protein
MDGETVGGIQVTLMTMTMTMTMEAPHLKLLFKNRNRQDRRGILPIKRRPAAHHAAGLSPRLNHQKFS